jgi:hypothetical protein
LSQSVVQSNVGGLVEQLVMQSDPQLVTQVASADVVHWELHCCSSLTAHASSQLSGAHSVVQSFSVTREHCALALISMSPHAETPACAVCGKATRQVNGKADTA